MNCKAIQRRLLAQTSPHRLAGELRAHLAYCSECRSWRRRLIRLEANVPLLPVPRSHGKSRLVRKLIVSPTPHAPEAPPAPEQTKPRAPTPFLVWPFLYITPFTSSAAALTALFILTLLGRDDRV